MQVLFYSPRDVTVRFVGLIVTEKVTVAAVTLETPTDISSEVR